MYSERGQCKAAWDTQKSMDIVIIKKGKVRYVHKPREASIYIVCRI